MRVDHIGLDADFDHPKGRDLALSSDVIHAFETDRELAEIFTQVSTGATYSSAEMLAWFLTQSDTTIEDHLPPTAKHNGPPILLTIPIRFGPEPFTMDTVEGPTALRSLKILIRVRIMTPPVQH